MAGIEKSAGYNKNVANYATQFVQKFDEKIGIEEPSVSISGRVLRGKRPEDFESLTDTPEKRKVVFTLDSSGLDNLVGKSGRGVLEQIGYPASDIDAFLEQDTRFKLVVFPEQSVKPATWGNLFNEVCDAYPNEADGLRRVEDQISHMTYDQAMKAGEEVAKAREFLHKTVNVNTEFTGTGLTSKDLPEFVTKNKPLTDLAPYILIGFHVK